MFIIFLMTNLYWMCMRKVRTKVIRRKVIISEMTLLSGEMD